MFDAFDFTEEELLANRVGKLSARQHRRLDEYLSVAKKRSRFASIVCLGSVVLLFGIAFFTQPNQFLQSLPYLSITASLYLLIFSPFLIMDVNKLRRLNAREVRHVDGTAHCTQRTLRNGRWTAYYVTVDKVRFQIHRDGYEVFKDGMKVRVFFLHYPPTHWILSVEQK